MARLEFAAHAADHGPFEGGAIDPLFELGLQYSAGRDVEPDLVQAHKWFNLAALRGNAEAKRYRAEIAADLSKAEQATALKLAREWLAAN